MKIPEDILGTLTDEQRKMAEGAKTSEELLMIAKDTGYDLSEEQLNALSGGWCGFDCGPYNPDCPYFVPKEG